MLTDNDESFQPKSLIIHSADFVENLQRQMGVINFNQAFGNHNAWYEGAMKAIYMIESAIEQGVIDLSKHPELKLNESAVYKLKRLWSGQCYITMINRDPATEQFHFDESHIDYSNSELEVIPIPALDQMDLVRKKSEKTLLVQISEQMPYKYAWEGLNYATLIEDAGFKIKTREGMIPKISQEDMYSETDFTEYISRHVYNRIIKKLKDRFILHWNVVYVNIHKIIHYLKIGIKEEAESPYTSKRMKGVE